jgi:dienelactone hydrolase
MKSYLLAVALLITSLHIGAQDNSSHKKTANAVLNLLQQNKFSEAITYFDSAYSKRVGAEKLEQSWRAIVASSGAYVKTNDAKESKQFKFISVVLKCEFERRNIDMKMVFNAQDKISSFSIAPEHFKDAYELPSYYDSSKVEEKQVKIISGEYVLPGTLSLPAKGIKFPLVILVHSAGAYDRDETVGSAKMFKDLALGLAMKGIAVLRYDKRAKVYPNLIHQKKLPSVKEETMDDVAAAIKTMKNNPAVDASHIFLIGHGFGGMLLPRIAKSFPDLKGIFLLAANTEKLEDVFYNESVYLLSHDSITDKKAAYLDTLKKQVEIIKHLTPASVNESTIPDRLLRFPKSYWVDLNNYNQVEAAKQLSLPIYILQGGQDNQLSSKDFDDWKKNLSQKKNTQFKWYPDLNHLFIESSKDNAAGSYSRKGNVAGYVIDDIANWIEPHKGK